MKRAATSIWAIALCALISLAGCNPAEKFTVTEVATPTLDGFSAIRGVATIENNSRRNLKIERVTLSLHYRDRILGSARLASPLFLPPRQTSTVEYHLVIDDFSLSSLATIASRSVSNPDRLTLQGEIWLMHGATRKKFQLKNITLEQLMNFINTFAP
jgi:hypothetical protein